jgi:hypothetical protein
MGICKLSKFFSIFIFPKKSLQALSNKGLQRLCKKRKSTDFIARMPKALLVLRFSDRCRKCLLVAAFRQYTIIDELANSDFFVMHN